VLAAVPDIMDLTVDIEQHPAGHGSAERPASGRGQQAAS